MNNRNNSLAAVFAATNSGLEQGYMAPQISGASMPSVRVNSVCTLTTLPHTSGGKPPSRFRRA